jgi:hypothetical protein
MAPGIFGKIGDFFKNIWGGIQSVVKPVWEGIKTVRVTLLVLKTCVPGYSEVAAGGTTLELLRSGKA